MGRVAAGMARGDEYDPGRAKGMETPSVLFARSARGKLPPEHVPGEEEQSAGRFASGFAARRPLIRSVVTIAGVERMHTSIRLPVTGRPQAGHEPWTKSESNGFHHMSSGAGVLRPSAPLAKQDISLTWPHLFSCVDMLRFVAGASPQFVVASFVYKRPRRSTVQPRGRFELEPKPPHELRSASCPNARTWAGTWSAGPGRRAGRAEPGGCRRS